ncbi:MAG: 30S ribosomal protein S6 [Proteobacteria bacterium]|nr:30S ribosomal protein S6 [Pseudomonadota bacterium]
MRHYETVFIIQPEISEEDYKGVVKKFGDLLEKQKGTTIRVEEWGTQRLAYRLGKFDKGAYVLLNYCGESGITAELGRGLKLDDRVLLFQTVKLADDVDPEELLLKEMEGRKKGVTEAEPGQAGVESGQEKRVASEEEVKGDV